jgi:hypothetical protein
MKKIHKLIVSCIAIIGLTACSDFQNLSWQPEFFSPLAKGKITLEDVVSSEELSYNFTANLPLVAPPVSSPYPAFGPLSTNANTLNFNSPVVSVLIDSLKISGSLTNPMPILISPGVELVFRKPGNATPVFKFTITQTIPAKSTINFSFIQTNIELTPQFTCTLENVSSPGSTTPVNFGSTQPRFQVSFQMDLIKVNSITIQNNVSDYYETTNDFDAGIDTQDDISGKLILNIKNSFPIALGLQAYLLDNNKKVLDSLFTPIFAIQSGTPQNPKTASATITADKVIKDLKTASFIKVRAYYTTTGSSAPVTVTKDSKLDFQLTGDLKLTVKPQ